MGAVLETPVAVEEVLLSGFDAGKNLLDRDLFTRVPSIGELSRSFVMRVLRSVVSGRHCVGEALSLCDWI